MLERLSNRLDKWSTRSETWRATKKAAELLEKRGVIEIGRETNLYRLKAQG